MDGYNQLTSKNCVIIGAGLSGLVSAFELAKRGYRIIVLEKENRIGGRLYPLVKEGFKADAGAQLIGDSYHYTFRLLYDLGLKNDLVKLNEPSAGIYSGNNIFLLNLLGLIKYNKLDFREKWDLLRLFSKVKKIGNRKHLTLTSVEKERYFDPISIAEWTIENFNEKILEYFVQPSLSALTLAEPEQLSAFYGLTLLYNDLRDSYTLKKGMSSMISILSQRLRDYGVEIKTDCEVRKIEVEDWTSYSIKYEINNEINSIETSSVICSTPIPITTKIFPSLTVGAKSSLSKIEYSSGLQVIVALNERVWDKTWAILIPRSELEDIALISESTLKCESFAPKGKGLMEVYIYGPTAKKLFKSDKSGIAKFAIDNLETLFPKISKKVLWHEVLRWERVIPIHSVDFSILINEFKTSIKGPTLAGDYLYLPSLESAVYSGIEAAKQVEKYHKGG